MPGLIPEHILEQIRQSNDVVDVIGSYFPLKRAGANFRALCPFHKEKTPSFNVNQQKQIWHCFGCGAGGNVFTFVMKYENLDFVAAVRRLAERAGITLEFESSAGEAEHSVAGQKEQLLKLHEEAAAFYHRQLMKEPAAAVAREYLKGRAVGSETARKWQLGYAPDAWDALIQWAKTRDYPVSLLETAGLVVRKEGGPDEARYYDRFRARLMFPIGDEQGRVVGFSGRILTDAKDQPKYVNSPETPIFHKGKILFALHQAKKAILDQNHAIICEGQMDTITCHEAGVANVVAPQGTALTEQHARILKRYTDEVVLMFDADAAGQNAAVRSAEPLLAAGLVIKVVVLPKGHDPDSYVKAFGAEKLQKDVTNAPSFFVYLLDRLTSQFDVRSDRGKLKIAQQMVESLAKIPNAILQSTYVRQTAARLDIPEIAVIQELRKSKSGQRYEPVKDESEEISTESEAAEFSPGKPDGLPAEETLLQSMLSDDRVIVLVQDGLNTEWLSDSITSELIVEVLSAYSAGAWVGPQTLLSRRSETEHCRVLSAILLRPPIRGSAAVAAQECLVSLEGKWLKARLADIHKRLKRADLESSAMLKLQQEALDLRRKLDNITRLSMEKT